MYVSGRFWTYFESYASSVIRKGTTVVLRHATSFSPSRIRNFVSYFIHNTLWAYPSVTQLKKLVADFFILYLIWPSILPHQQESSALGQSEAMFVERSFLDLEYSFVAVWRIRPTRFAEYSEVGSWTNIRLIKNGLWALRDSQTSLQRYSSVIFTCSCLSKRLFV